MPWRLTEALVAELSVCVALGWSLYEIYSVQKFDQSRHLAKTKLHPEYPRRKKMNIALKHQISVFCEPEHPKNMQLLDKIHTVFTAALTDSYISGVKSPFRRGRRFLGEDPKKKQVPKAALPKSPQIHVSGNLCRTMLEYRLYYARGRIIVVILESCQALRLLQGYAMLRATRLLIQSSESSLPPSFLLASRLGLLRPSPFVGLR